MNENEVTKTVVSVTDMARMVGLSRARFYQLIRAGTFPEPDREPATGRPCYGEEKQRQCLEVRRRNCGINGEPILFYSRRLGAGPRKQKPPKPVLRAKRGDVMALVEGLNALGHVTATAAQVQQVIEELYPNGTEGLDQGEVLRAVFLHLRRRNQGDNVR